MARLSFRAALTLAVPLVVAACDGPVPHDLGPRADNTLLPCSSQVDCVNTGLRLPRGTRGVFVRGTVPFGSVMQRVRETVAEMPGAQVVTATDTYVHAEFRHGMLRNVDDLEALLLPTRELIVRSSPRRRSGGTRNVERVEELRRRLDEAGVIR